MAGNNGGPWGGGGNSGGGNNGDGDRGNNNGGGRRPGNDGPQIPEIDELMNKGREQLRVLMGGGQGGGRNNGAGGDGGGPPQITRGMVGMGAAIAFVAWLLFNLANPPQTIEAVSESAMREIISQSELAPILNRDRGAIADRLRDLIQSTLDSYDSGVNIIRVNFDKADPPEPVIAAFLAVQGAEQERDRLQNVADAYANQVVAGARGEAAQLLEQAEAYRSQVVNEAQGEASRFSAVLAEYEKAPEVTRKRLYLETMEEVLGGVDIILLDEGAGGGQGVVPYLPLNELRRTPSEGGSN